MLFEQLLARAGPSLNLESLKVSNNQLGIQSAMALGALLASPAVHSRPSSSQDSHRSGQGDGLRELDVGWNAIAGRGAKSLLEGALACRSLKRLDLSWNGIGDSNLLSPALIGQVPIRVTHCTLAFGPKACVFPLRTLMQILSVITHHIRGDWARTAFV